MKNKSKDIEESWRVYYLLISLPTKFLFTPFLREIKKANLDNFISGKITEKQFSTRWILRDYLANLLNSFSLGILFYLILRILKHYRKQT